MRKVTFQIYKTAIYFSYLNWSNPIQGLLVMFLHSLMCMSDVWCVTIHKMTAINKITAKIDHVLFTCNWCFGLRKRAHMCMLLQKSCPENFSKFQRLRWSLFPVKDDFYNWWMCFEKELCHNSFSMLRH